jgi:hypothetical protein
MGVKVDPHTRSLCLRKARTFWSLATSMRRMTPSQPEVASRRPSGLLNRHCPRSGGRGQGLIPEPFRRQETQGDKPNQSDNLRNCERRL